MKASQMLWRDIGAVRAVAPYDAGIVLGTIMTVGLVVAGSLSSGLGAQMFHLGSFVLVFGGTIGAALIHYSIDDVRHAWESLCSVVRIQQSDPSARIAELVDLSHKVRKDGVLVLEREGYAVVDPFLRTALQLTVDGHQPHDIRRILEHELRASLDHEKRAAQVFQTMGTYSPAMGLIGTLLGLIQMLATLDRPETLGPSMSLALLTTLYGALFANMFLLPMSGKIRNRTDEGALIKSITIEGVVSLGAQENPMVLEQRLTSFLPPVVKRAQGGL